ncbi:MAG: GatB/YqeY domain-containing protein [bacterium]|nr:GatB/YqeY domain-containing protein [bacterium]
MTLRQRLSQDLKGAQLKKEELRVSVLRLLFASLNNREIDKRTELTEEEVIEAIIFEVKKRREAIAAFRQGNRPALAEKEEKERLILEAYLPQAISESELRGIIKEVIEATSAQTINDLGRVMKELMPRIKKLGRAEGHLVNSLVKEMLAEVLNSNLSEN